MCPLARWRDPPSCTRASLTTMHTSVAHNFICQLFSIRNNLKKDKFILIILFFFILITIAIIAVITEKLAG